MKRVNAWMCAELTTDRDLASVIPDKKRESVITVLLQDLLFFFELISPVTFFL